MEYQDQQNAMWILEAYLNITARIAIKRKLYWDIAISPGIHISGYKVILQETPEDAYIQKSLSKNILDSLNKSSRNFHDVHLYQLQVVQKALKYQMRGNTICSRRGTNTAWRFSRYAKQIFARESLFLYIPYLSFSINSAIMQIKLSTVCQHC